MRLPALSVPVTERNIGWRNLIKLSQPFYHCAHRSIAVNEFSVQGAQQSIGRAIDWLLSCFLPTPYGLLIGPQYPRKPSLGKFHFKAKKPHFRTIEGLWKLYQPATNGFMKPLVVVNRDTSAVCRLMHGVAVFEPNVVKPAVSVMIHLLHSP